MTAQWAGVTEPHLRPAARHALPAPMPWRDRLGVTTQARAAPAIERPDEAPAWLSEHGTDRPVGHPCRCGPRL